MHLCHLVTRFVYRLLHVEEGFTMGEVMWSFAAVILIVGVAFAGGSAVSPEWREAVEGVIPIKKW
jgi:hypothetical protein